MLIVSICFLFPVVLIGLCQRVALLDRIGAVLLSFGAGILIAWGLDLPQLFSVDARSLQGSQTQLSEVSIALAIPLLLFSIDIRSAFRLAGATLKGFGFALVSVLTASLAGTLLFRGEVAHLWQVAGMAVGAYTGGGPNMAAIKTAIRGDEAVFMAMVTYDILFSAIYLVLVMTLGRQIVGRFLGPYRPSGREQDGNCGAMALMADETAAAYNRLVQKETLPRTLLSGIFACIVVGLSLLIAGFFPGSMASAATVITITTFGIAGSFIPGVRRLDTSFQLGMYLVLVFCFTMGTMTDASLLLHMDRSLAGYIVFLLAGSLILQLVLCRLFSVDTDTFLITASAAIMSVPFIPVVAGALKNRELLVPGFAVAILGYAAGNYLGILVANLSRWLAGG